MWEERGILQIAKKMITAILAKSERIFSTGKFLEKFTDSTSPPKACF